MIATDLSKQQALPNPNEIQQINFMENLNVCENVNNIITMFFIIEETKEIFHKELQKY